MILCLAGSRDEDKFGSLVMEALTLLISGNTNNANLFRSSGGSKIAHGLVSHPDSRQQVLGKKNC